MVAAVWSALLRDSRPIAAWLDAHMPSGWPHWLWAALLVAAALVVGRVGGRVLAGALQAALLLAAVLVAWQMVHAPAPARANGRAAAPLSCLLTGTCAKGSATGSPRTSGGTTRTSAAAVSLAARSGR